MNPKITVLLAARKNSKYLAKFLHGFFVNTHLIHDIQLLVMLNEEDTWNEDLVNYYCRFGIATTIKFLYEDLKLGRAGLHEYFNMLLPYAIGDWIIYFCEDHYIVMGGWDTFLREMISGDLAVNTELGPVLRHNFGPLDPNKVWCLVPSFDNAGPMNHVLSKGYIKAQGGYIARHGNLDSYINTITGRLYKDCTIRFDTDPAMFHDFTHDDPNPMSEAGMQSVISEAGQAMPRYDSTEIMQMLDEDVDKLRAAVEAEGQGGKRL